MIIREARVQDVNRISYLIRKNTLQVVENGHTPLQKEAWNTQNTPKAVKESLKKRKIFCAMENDKMVGTIAIEGNLLCGMYVSYSKRGKGIGNCLLVHLEKYAQEKGIQELILTATNNGYGFYLKNGYRDYGRMTHNFNGVKFPEFRMKKKLF